MTAQIETKLTQRGHPAIAAVEAESKKNDVKDAELSCAEVKEALASARDLGAKELSAITKQRSSVASQSASTVEVEQPNSRMCFASSICGGQHSSSYREIGDKMLCLLNAELDGDDSKKLCCITSFDVISAEKVIRSD